MSKELLFESDTTKIILADDPALGRHILKVLNIEYPTPPQIKQFFTEYEILREASLDTSRKAYSAKKQQGQYQISLEFVPGITLREWEQGNHTFQEKLIIARDIARALSELHSKNVIHRDLSNTNILINQETRKICIIDFGYASRFNTKVQHLGNPEHLLGTLPYISPEQSGRMNRQIDYRTDLYSLGVILFELFTGRLPFEMEDPLSLVHAHIAVAPPDPKSIKDTLPDVLSEIILKLLSKNAEERYDSANGLARDLDKCLERLDARGQIAYFRIQEQDFSGRFKINQKLYGREEEISLLYKTFEYVSTGPSEMILVAGFSGTGKSSLVHEIHKPITEKRGIFLEGKFDQYQRGLPYFAIIRAFESFVNILLSEDEKTLNHFVELIREAVGEEGKVLTDIIPSLELIIGKQPAVADVGGLEAQNRFNYVFRKFINAISSEAHPIILFIDDVQWADSGSLDLLSSVMTDKENQYLMCICAYRDNEVSPSHPFTRMVEELKMERVPIQEITLSNLSFENVNDLISDSLNLTRSETASLTELVQNKTGGNAFFVNQFLKSLYEEEYLFFNFHEYRWEWDMEKIRKHNLTDDVVALMSGKIVRLPQKTQETIKLASCVGSTFELPILAVIAQESPEDCEKSLSVVLSEGLIQQNEDETYSFSHDRIQQAAYSLIPKEDRPPLHYQIGKLLEERLSEEELEERLFDVVNQFNQGAVMMTSGQERSELSSLNLRAGIKAKEASAFTPALSYLESGIRLLDEDAWNKEYKKSLELHTQAAEAAFLSSRFEDMEAYIKAVEVNGTRIQDKLKALEIRIHALKAKNKLKEALNSGMDLMDQLGEKLPRNPNQLMTMADLAKTLLSLRGMTDEKILALPNATNEAKAAAMRICAIIAPSSYWGRPEVFPFIIWRLIRLSIKYGNTPVSSFGYSTHGVILVGIFKLFRSGNRFGQLGLKVLDKLKAKEWVTQVYTPVYALIVIWNDHIEKTLKPLQESYHIGLETGAIEFACVNANIYCIHAFFLGKPLPNTEVETRAYSENFHGFHQETNHKYNEIYRQCMLNLLGRSEDPLLLTGEAINEEEMFRLNKENNDRTGTFFIYFHKMLLYYLFGKYEKAWEMALEARALLDAVLAKAEVAYFHFYEGLTAGALLNADSPISKSELSKRLRKNIRQFKSWAKAAPMNFKHKSALLQGLYFKHKNQRENAKDAFETAIQGAVENRYLNDEAMTYQCVADYYASIGNTQLQDFYLNKAFQTYQDWGAFAVMEDLLNKHPDVIYTERKRKSGSKGSMTSSSGGQGVLGQNIDIASILKASTSISQEIVLSKLLQRMMTILIENLGATRGCLLLIEDGKLVIGIETDNTGKSSHILEKLPMKDSGLVPEKVIAYTRRTKEKLVFANIQEHESFGKDPYILKNKPISAISFPIIHQGNQRGILYFENDLAEGAFTNERIQLLSLLSGQISTSLDNALLYENLEQKVADRTAQLADEKKKSDELLLNILPEKTAAELKVNGFAKPKRFDKITVMFTDFKDFTLLSQGMSPEDLVRIIDTYFRKFDEIIGKYGIEKIKTIGDSYMCASGLNYEPDHAYKMVLASMDILAFMEEEKKRLTDSGLKHFAIRIGINSGPVVAGVVGSKKFAYDIWGDTVNTASRMESNCGPWNINISGDTYALVKGRFECFHRGKIEAKNKGKIDMYYVLEEINQPA